MMRIIPPLTDGIRLGTPIVLVTCLLDQLSKLTMLHIVDLSTRPIPVLPFMDFVLVWNRGVSYGLFAAGSAQATWLLIGVSLLITLVMAHYLSAQTTRLGVWGFALIIGGAAGNLIDRVAYGAVVDFVSLYGWGYYFYVFNFADICITLGVVLFLLDAWRDTRHR